MDGYSRVKLLGEGSFGRVFLMREKKSGGRLVCVKQVHRVHQSKKQAFAPPGRDRSSGVEVDLMKKLRHPNLIRLLKSFVGPSPLRQQHIVMEYCSGGDLRNYLKAASRVDGNQPLCLAEDKIWYWFVQLALGLHHMHDQRVLHRDVKTANIFLSNAGYLVLGDLGIARKLSSGDAAATVIGTPLYMAPEVLDELRPSVEQLLRDSIARVHIRRYCVDRLRSTSMTGEERRVMIQQVTALGIDAKIVSTIPAVGGNDVKNEEASVHASVNSISRHQGRNAQHREDIEKHLQGVREHERQEQLLFALEKLQQLRLQFPACQPEQKVEAPESNHEAAKPLVPPIDLHKVTRKQSPRDEGWRDPVRAVTDSTKSSGRRQPRAPAPLGRSNSVPKGMAFTGAPRPGVPLTGMSKTFVARRPVCRDVRSLRQQEAAKAAERYKRRLDAMSTPRQRNEDKVAAAPKPAASTRRRRSVDAGGRAAGRNKDEEDIDAAILQSMAGLRQALA
ncbi:NEK/NEK1 protein kinase [Phytophthora cinnamomi]|uniref:NEK/NEK1 protein kinase n=1 Tax=Phytophthora cinnamomi TaxID=4785 RepID=UPI00355A28C2|nr:NEK/NEK1 protein kinase [Phytophthora cinnamomi]